MFKFSSIASTVAVVLLLMACKGEDKPLMLPPSVPVHALYEQLQNDKELNPTRVDRWIDQRQIRAFHGSITKIDDSKVQFHIKERFLASDLYVECKFANRNSVLLLNKGQNISVYGHLTRVNDVIVFENCGFGP